MITGWALGILSSSDSLFCNCYNAAPNKSQRRAGRSDKYSNINSRLVIHILFSCKQSLLAKFVKIMMFDEEWWRAHFMWELQIGLKRFHKYFLKDCRALRIVSIFQVRTYLVAVSMIFSSLTLILNGISTHNTADIFLCNNSHWEHSAYLGNHLIF